MTTLHFGHLRAGSTLSIQGPRGILPGQLRNGMAQALICSRTSGGKPRISELTSKEGNMHSHYRS